MNSPVLKDVILEKTPTFKLIIDIDLHGRYEQVLLLGTPQQLRHNLDLLPARQQIAERHTRDTRHLHVVDDAHELLDQPQRQIGVLQAVHGQATPRLVAAVLEVRDYGVVHVLLLLLQKVVADGVEGVGAELVVSDEHQKQVENDATFVISEDYNYKRSYVVYLITS